MCVGARVPRLRYRLMRLAAAENQFVSINLTFHIQPLELCGSRWVVSFTQIRASVPNQIPASRQPSFFRPLQLLQCLPIMFQVPSTEQHPCDLHRSGMQVLTVCVISFGALAQHTNEKKNKQKKQHFIPKYVLRLTGTRTAVVPVHSG